MKKIIITKTVSKFLRENEETLTIVERLAKLKKPELEFILRQTSKFLDVLAL